MNWFQRNAIPGAYFWILGFLFAFSYFDMCFEQMMMFFAIATFTFMPIGYLFICFQNIIYLHNRKLGLHYAAKKSVPEFSFSNLDFLKIDFKLEPNNEISVETYTMIIVAYYKDVFCTKVFPEDWSWITKRMDAMSIDFALFWISCLFLLVSAVFFLLYWNCFILLNNLLTQLIGVGFALFAIVVTKIQRQSLRAQLVPAIAEIYKKFSKNGEDDIS